MRRVLAVSLFLLALSAAASSTARLIELRDHSRILAMDEPVHKGRVLVFHRYPDGVFVSIPADSVLGIAMTTVSPASSQKAKFLAGETIVLGPTGQGPSPSEKRSIRDTVAPVSYSDSSEDFYPYGGYPYAGCCSGPPVSPPRPSAAPALVGPNGYPGTPWRDIGSNGFPILAPSPVRR